MDVKNELARVAVLQGPLRAAEIATVVRFAGGLHRISNRTVVEIELDCEAVVNRVGRGLVELYGADVQVVPSGTGTGDGYIIRVARGGEALARQTGIIDARGRLIRGLPSVLVNGSRDITISVWRGALMARGSLTDPGRSATLEVVCPGNEAAMALVGAARRLDIPVKAREVRGVYRAVIRDPDAIAAMLTQVGAISALDDWQAVRQRRVNRAAANRLVNFDDANLRRSAQAAVAAGARVERALEILGDDIPEHLRYAGQLRLAHKQASLDELGHLADPPMTKDAVAGRIRRLLAMADRRAAELGIPNTDASLSEGIDEIS